MTLLSTLSLLVVVWVVSEGAELCPRGAECVSRSSCRGRVVPSSHPYSCTHKNSGKVCCVTYTRPQHHTSSTHSRKDKHGHGSPGYRMDYYDDRYEGIYGGLSRHAKEVLRNFRYKDECGVRTEEPENLARISTGYLPDQGLTSFGEFGWHVALLVRERQFNSVYRSNTKIYRYHCGATLIHPVLVLTAAHCVKGIKTKRLSVHMGNWNLHGSTGELFPAVERKVSRVFIHSGYNPATYLNDIALLQLDRPVDLAKTPHIRPACLPEDNYKFEDEKKCYIVGWGEDVYKPRFGSNILKATTVTYLTAEDCEDKLYATLPKVHDDFVLDEDLQRCITGGYGRDACVGDGGGAVVCALDNVEGPDACQEDHNCQPEHFYVAGIISFGSPVCGEGSVTVITDIVEHVNWINTILGPAGGLHNYNYKYYKNEHGGGYLGRVAAIGRDGLHGNDTVVEEEA
ncbi:hypothetical protein Pcinc_014218 [Petrolisthes cinctipes]|uniref:Peptidase S1 domain-containing protein n=1 Tax=Petrolisthes cinctipes TaxID=88211 RepID=A0AAE1KPG2_PETCI|nr:hypothetical protein Pcinc_014218 [Petrolisthes cinctipes]